MKLNIKERIILLNIMPEENNFITLKIIRKLKENLSFSEKELKEFEIKINTNNSVTWNVKKEQDKEIDIGEKATDIIIEALMELDKNKKLTEQHISLYEKFVNN